MHTLYNDTRHKNDWALEKWYEKTYYVIGLITTWAMIAAFMVGFIKGVWEG